MDRDGFAQLVGDRQIHVTAVENIANIRRFGLTSPAALAEAMGLDPAELVLRDGRVVLEGAGCARRSITKRRSARDAAAVTSSSPATTSRGGARSSAGESSSGRPGWAHASRTPSRATCRSPRSRSLRGGSSTSLLRGLTSPTNSGNAPPRLCWHDDWLYVPVSESPEAFARNRCGLLKTRDMVREVSIIESVAPERLAEIENPEAA